MRTYVIITRITAAAVLVVAGCGDRARNDDAAYDPPASYESIAHDRTRGRDDQPQSTASAGGGDVQSAYDSARAEERGRGSLGTAGERARAGQPTDPGNDSFGGSSAGSESPSDVAAPIPARPETGAPSGEPIPYAGSRRIDAPYPGLPSDGGDRLKPKPAEPLPTPMRRDPPRYQGIPPADNGADMTRPGY